MQILRHLLVYASFKSTCESSAWLTDRILLYYAIYSAAKQSLQIKKYQRIREYEARAPHHTNDMKLLWSKYPKREKKSGEKIKDIL